MREIRNRKRMSRLIVMFLLLVLLLMYVPTQTIAQTEMIMSPEESVYDLQAIPAAKHDFKLSCNPEAVLYGHQKEQYLGRLYFFESNKLYAESDDCKSVVAECDGANINITNNRLYFTSFENGRAEIRCVDLDSGAVSIELVAGQEQIRNFYIVNNNTMMYLAGGSVYSCQIGKYQIDCISHINNILSFVPTDSGNLYAVGELFNCSIYLDDIHLLDKTAYYSIDIEKDHFVAAVDGTLFQIPMAKLRGFCRKVMDEGLENNADLLPYMVEYNLYGTYNAVELLGLGDEEHCCSYCEGHTNEIEQEDINKADLYGTETRSIVPLSNVGKMIMSQSNSLTQYSWQPCSNVRKYNSTDYFESTGLVTGIPYSRPGKFDGTPYAGYMKYIIYGAGDTSEAVTGTIVGMSFDSFKTKIANQNSMFYGGAASIAPLYGTDCSGFVSYCWGVQTKLGTSHFGSGVDGTYYCTALNITNVSSLSILQVGDALVKTGNNGHVVMISQINVDNNGNLSSLTITEETPPKTRSQSYTPSTFYSHYISEGYSAYRPYSYKITFKGNGGTPSIPYMYVIANVPYSAGNGLPTATRANYSFAGWYTAASGGTRVTNSSCSDTTARTLYAHWQNAQVQMPDDCILPDTRIRYSNISK